MPTAFHKLAGTKTTSIYKERQKNHSRAFEAMKCDAASKYLTAGSQI